MKETVSVAGDWLTAGLPFAAGALLLALQGIEAVDAAAPLAAFVLAWTCAAAAATARPILPPRAHRLAALALTALYGTWLLAAWFRA